MEREYASKYNGGRCGGMKTYDILNAGSRNRFMANGRVVSNSGRAIQLQNLVRNDLTTLDEARE